MQVRITIEVEGQKIAEHVEAVQGTLEELEEKAITLARSVGRDTLQALVNATPESRPPFQRSLATCGTKAMKAGPSSGCRAR